MKVVTIIGKNTFQEESDLHLSHRASQANIKTQITKKKIIAKNEIDIILVAFYI